MIFSNIKQFLKQNKKIFYYLGFFVVMFSVMSDTTFAADFAEIKKTTSTVAEWLLKWVSVLLALITYLATIFLSPEWINGSLFGLNTYFKDVWILVSNVVYFIFAFILIWVAFMNIVWRTWEQYQLKQALPKFIVWVLIVPFSWFLVQFILSVSAVLTISALTLPFDTFDKFESKLTEVKIPKSCTINLSAKDKDWNSIDSFIDCPREWAVDLIPLIQEWESIDTIFWIISMYTYWIISFDTVWDVDWFDLNSVTNLWDLIVKIIFDLLFVIIYSILMITLWIVLMIRWIYIWIYTMISPVFWLMYFFDKKEWWEWFFWKFNVKEFISLAMVPVYTMLALSFWLLFLYVVWAGMTSEEAISQTKTVSIEKSACEWTDAKDSCIKINDFQLVIKWAVSRDEDGTWLLKNIWWTWLWIVWALILKLFGIIVLWWTIMAAMRSSEITKTITQPIYDFGSKVWWIVTAAPGNIPIFGGQSMKSMDSVASQVSGWISSAQSKRASDFIWKHPFLPWSNWASNIADLTAIRNTMNWKSWDPIAQIKAVEEGMIKAWSAENAKNLESSRLLILDALKNLNLNKDWKITIDTLKDQKGFEDAMNKIDAEATKRNMEFIPGKDWTDIQMKDINKFIKKWETSDTSSSVWNNNITSQVVNNNMVFDLPWVWKINWNTNWWSEVESFNTDDYKDLANYITKNNMSNDDFQHLMNELNVKSGKTDSIKDEIWKYFKSDWTKDVTQSSWDKSALKKYLDWNK